MMKLSKLHKSTVKSAAAIVLCAVLLSGCSGDFLEGADEKLDYTLPTFNQTTSTSTPAAGLPRLTPVPSAVATAAVSNDTAVLVPKTGAKQESNEYAVIDISNIAEGYFAAKNLISDKRVKMQVVSPNGTTYTYTLSGSAKYEYFPLTQGDGEYTVNVYKNLSGDQYAFVAGTSFKAKLTNEFSPFLYPNQYVWFEPNDKIVSVSSEVCAGAKDDLEAVTLIYDYVIGNIAYDYDKYDTLADSYLPNCDKILSAKSGICFDYAAVMSAMLRLEGIPTKLVVGYAGELKHAWISVYIEEIGWVDDIIRFDGKNWVRMDPTFAANATDDNLDTLAAYIGDGKNYNDMYFY